MVPGWLQILLIILLFVLLFGRGKIADVMGDVAKGIKSFKSGLTDEDEGKAEVDSDPKVIDHETPVPEAKTQTTPKSGSS